MDVVAAYQDKLDAYGYVPIDHDKPNFFPVDLLPCFDGDRNELPGVKRLVRTDTNELLKIHSDSYGLISYEDSFAKFDEELQKSGLDTKGMMVATDMSHNGGRCFRQYVLPQHLVNTPDGEGLALRFLMFNSYDGSTKFRGRAGGYHFVCANTSCLGTDIINVGAKHTKNAGLQIENVIEQVVKSADDFMSWGPRFENWGEVKPEPDTAYYVLTELPFAEQHIDRMFAMWMLDEEGSLYGLYNAMTAWSTFSAGGENRAASRADREARIATLIEGEVWGAAALGTGGQ